MCVNSGRVNAFILLKDISPIIDCVKENKSPVINESKDCIPEELINFPSYFLSNTKIIKTVMEVHKQISAGILYVISCSISWLYCREYP